MYTMQSKFRSMTVTALTTSLILIAVSAVPSFGQAASGTANIKVDSERIAQKPISKLIFGHFIESGFGRQTDGMWAEMIFNRSFVQPVPPFNFKTWEWLMLKPEFYNTNAPFWHSGYEEYDWETIDEHTATSRVLGVQSFKGLSSLRIDYDGQSDRGGIRQKGLYLKDGQSYDFSVFGGFASRRGRDEQTRDLHVILKPENNPDKVIFEKTLKLEPSQKQFDFKIQPDGFTGRATLEFSFTSQGGINLSWCSMMPSDNIRGWNAEVVKLLKKVAVPIIRFPGGCFASFYDWKDTVGPRSQRRALESYYWGGLEENDVGIDEFLDLCYELKCEPQIAVNMMSSTPFKAMELVQYCNGPDNSHMGQLRIFNGIERKNRVNYWEMDNEAGRKWTAQEYAQQIVKFAAQMRKADPTIKIMMECYSYDRRGTNGALAQMLEIAGSQADLVITRASDPESIQNLLKVIRDYNAKSGRKILLCNTEWLATRGDAVEPFDDPEIPQRGGWRPAQLEDYRKVLSFRQIHWFYGLNVGKILISYLSHGGELNHTNFNNCCNTWGQNIIESAKEGAWLSAAGRVFDFMKNKNLAYPLKTGLTAGDDVYLTAQACSTEDGNMIIFIVNQGTKTVPIKLELPSGSKVTTTETLFAPDRLSRAKLNDDQIQFERRDVTSTDLTLRSISITKVFVEANL